MLDAGYSSEFKLDFICISDCQGNVYKQFINIDQNDTYDCPGFFQHHFCHPNVKNVVRYLRV